MKLYNTLTRRKENFVPMSPGQVKMYCCGPTVYNLFHIGNARSFVVFDTLRRYLEYRGMRVTFVQNFTDIDDKIIKRAGEEGISCRQVAEKYIEEYYTDAHGLGIRDATVHPKATENIEEIIDFIKALEEKGLAYTSGGDVYYRARAFSGYGKLSHQPIDDLEAGARVAADEQKEDPIDFALWKGQKPGEPAWDSPWGPGRPGWHIECSAMARRFLGETIDIHAGGIDLCFPHHENEIAQSEGASGKPFARYWLHISFLNVDNKKMSKSLGNFFMVRDAAKKYGYAAIRFFLLSAHYRSPINYTDESLTQAGAALERIDGVLRQLAFLKENGESGLSDEEKDSIGKFHSYREKFCRAMDDDLNTADALSAIFELVREINTIAGGQGSRQYAEAAWDALSELCDVLGVGNIKPEQDATQEIEQLIASRQDARKVKNFAEADRIRDQLKAMGILLEDTPLGVKWSRAK